MRGCFRGSLLCPAYRRALALPGTEETRSQRPPPCKPCGRTYCSALARSARTVALIAMPAACPAASAPKHRRSWRRANAPRRTPPHPPLLPPHNQHACPCRGGRRLREVAGVRLLARQPRASPGPRAHALPWSNATATPCPPCAATATLTAAAAPAIATPAPPLLGRRQKSQRRCRREHGEQRHGSRRKREAGEVAPPPAGSLADAEAARAKAVRNPTSRRAY